MMLALLSTVVPLVISGKSDLSKKRGLRQNKKSPPIFIYTAPVDVFRPRQDRPAKNGERIFFLLL
jgi:hypothetical protein